MPLSGAAIREQLRATIEQRLSVDALEDWIIRASWNIHLTDTPREVQVLVWAIDHDLAARADNTTVRCRLQARLAAAERLA